MEYKLRIPTEKVKYYSEQYDFRAETKLEKYHKIGPNQGHLTADQLYEICRWKSKRKAARAKSNPDVYVKEITTFSFGAKCERSRIGSLMLLYGVKMPTASVILHFCVDQTYPILDVRALWSLSIAKPSMYSFDFWEGYTEICRKVAKELSMSVRELDMALWQYSKKHQPKAAN
ncbi:MAG TPA: hypothetical protein VKF36_04475 [Syntrophorhabdales bacterium]|nr:hypothetical protein [Syntrophorhabdales bacterium]